MNNSRFQFGFVEVNGINVDLKVFGGDSLVLKETFVE